MADISSISVKLGLSTVEWKENTDQAIASANKLRSAFDNLGGGIGKLSQVWQQFGSVFSAAAFGAVVHEAIALTDEISDLAKGFDLTIAQTLKFSDALVVAGAKSEGAARIMSTMFAKVDEAKQGGDKAIATFEKLGISFDELKAMSPYEAINKIAQGFQNVNDTFEKTKLIKEFMGKAGIGVSIKELNDALQEGSSKYDKYEDSIAKFGEIADNVARSMKNLKIAVADLLAGFYEPGLISIERFSQGLKAIAAGAITAGILSVAAAFVKLGLAIREAMVAGAAFNVIAGPTNPLGIAIKLLAAGAAAIVFFKNSPSENLPGVTEGTMSAKTTADIERESGDGKDAAAKQESESKEAAIKRLQVSLTQQLLAIDRQRFKIQEDFLNVDLLHNQIRMNELDTQEKLLQVDMKLKQNLEQMGNDASKQLIAQTKAEAQAEKNRIKEASASKAKLLRDKDAWNKHQLELQQEIDYQRSLGSIGMDYEQETAQQRRDAEDARVRARVDLFNQYKETVRLMNLEGDRIEREKELLGMSERERAVAMERYDLEAKIAEYRRQAVAKGEGEERIEAVSKSMREAGERTIQLKQDTIDAQRTFEYGWNEAFNKFVDESTNAANIGRDMFNTMAGSISGAIDTFVRNGKLSVKDFAKSFIQSLIAIEMKAQAMTMFRFALRSLGFGAPSVVPMQPGGGYADGGDPPVNQVSLVGERGPELFVPRTAGTIIPNHSLAGMMGGGQTVNYNGPFIQNMSAIDTQSGIQFLSRNKQAVWAANQSAQRSLPVSK